jgi:hypothetical protein
MRLMNPIVKRCRRKCHAGGGAALGAALDAADAAAHAAGGPRLRDHAPARPRAGRPRGGAAPRGEPRNPQIRMHIFMYTLRCTAPWRTCATRRAEPLTKFIPDLKHLLVHVLNGPAEGLRHKTAGVSAWGLSLPNVR